LLTLAWELAPELVLINYVVFVLHKTLFEVTLIACASSLASIIGTHASERAPKGKGFQAIGAGMLINAFYALIMALSSPFWLVPSFTRSATSEAPSGSRSTAPGPSS